MPIRRSITRKERWVRTGPVHKSTRKTREIRNREEGNREERLAGRKWEIGLGIMDLGIYLDAWV